MQEVQHIETGERFREFFTGHSEAEMIRKMDSRLAEQKAAGFTLVRREKIGRNAACPCGSGLKFKKCCISQLDPGR